MSQQLKDDYRRPVSVSVIISIYNLYNWLEAILESLRCQTVTEGVEIVIADDGSSEETVANIKQYIKDHPQMNIVHVWHPDDGWQKCQILNKAVRASSGEYLIFVDGDCVPHRRFIEDHISLARPNTAVTGRRVDLPERLSRRIENGKPLNYLGWRLFGSAMTDLLTHGHCKVKNLSHIKYATRLTGKFWLSKGSVLGCNFGLWRSMLYDLNGFDERYLWPACGEDADLDVRLRNGGYTIVRATHMALMVHRCHKRRQYYYPENEALISAARSSGLVRAPKGLVD